MKQIMTRLTALLLALVMTTTLALAANKSGYSDVPDKHWAAESIAQCKQYNLLQGTGSGKQECQNGAEGGFLHHSSSPFANAALQRSFREKRRSGRAYKAITLTLLYPTQRAITTRTFVKY